MCARVVFSLIQYIQMCCLLSFQVTCLLIYGLVLEHCHFSCSRFAPPSINPRFIRFPLNHLHSYGILPVLTIHVHLLSSNLIHQFHQFLNQSLMRRHHINIFMNVLYQFHPNCSFLLIFLTFFDSLPLAFFKIAMEAMTHWVPWGFPIKLSMGISQPW